MLTPWTAFTERSRRPKTKSELGHKNTTHVPQNEWCGCLRPLSSDSRSNALGQSSDHFAALAIRSTTSVDLSKWRDTASTPPVCPLFSVPIVLSQLLNLAVHSWPIRSPRMTRRTKMCAHGLPVQCSYPYMWRLRHMALKALRCMFLFAGLDDGSPVLGSAFGRWQERSVRRRRVAGKAMGGVQLFLPATRGLHSPLDTCLSNATALGNCQIVD